MGKQFLVLLLFSVATLASGDDIAMKTWFKKTDLSKQKVTQLQLYVQDILQGPTPTNVVVASANSTATSPTSFGLVVVLDDPVRIGPDPNSKTVGRFQGFYTFSSLEEQSIHLSFDFVFTTGKLNGSTLTLVGNNRFLREHREVPIVGGSGVFRLARGFAGVRTVSFTEFIFEYNLTILHY
ncbi:Dirigent protein 1 [Sesamum alatum]|uniref:Dirigent protein n=1 Tax=Sesamum alatum TaxID=300844 RepID=A0AAE1YWF2_9LAMI|nr:Dirigent protein 1 [Sesamum alatum]